MRKLVGGRIREELIIANWPDLFRCAATMAAGKIKRSQLFRKLASYPRQNDLAFALREVGRVERTLFISEWILDAEMQRRAQIGLIRNRPHIRSYEAGLMQATEEFGEAVRLSAIGIVALKHLEGQTMREAAFALGTTPFDLLVRFVEEDEGQTGIILFQLDERDLHAACCNRLFMAGSDGLLHPALAADLVLFEDTITDHVTF